MSNITRSILLWKKANLSLAFTEHCSRFISKLETDLTLELNDFVLWCDATETSANPVFADLEAAVNVALTWLEFTAGEAKTEDDIMEVSSFASLIKYDLKGLVIQQMKRIAA